MAPLDNPALFPDLSVIAPSGENLEFDPDFAEMERLAQGKPEQQYGSTIVPAEEPEWKKVITSATALMARTCDLRVIMQLAVALLQQEGVSRYAELVGVAHQVLSTRWETVHPQLDAEDDNDPTLRANILLGLAEPLRVIRLLRNLPLARSARAGVVSWRDAMITAGVLEAEKGAQKLTGAVITAIFRDTDPEALATLRAALRAAEAGAAGIVRVFDEQAGHGAGPDFSELAKLLREMLGVMDKYADDTAEAPDMEQPVEAAEATPDADAAPVRAVQTIATMGPPTTRKDATRLLELVIAYYEQYEPSSPLPLLIRRARRLADKDFMDILRDMAPGGVDQAEMLAGRGE